MNLLGSDIGVQFTFLGLFLSDPSIKVICSHITR